MRARETELRRLSITPHDDLVQLCERVAPEAIVFNTGFDTADSSKCITQAKAVAANSRKCYAGMSQNPAFRFLGSVEGEPNLQAVSFNAEQIPPHNAKYDTMTVLSTRPAFTVGLEDQVIEALKSDASLSMKVRNQKGGGGGISRQTDSLWYLYIAWTPVEVEDQLMGF